MNDIEKVDWNKIKLAVVMPSYNRSEYIGQAVESVLNQETDFTILLAITDDASTDSSADAISKYEKKYPQKILAIYSEENKGLLANDIKIFEQMKSDYFCVLDPDDYWVDNKFLQKAVDFLEENSDYVIYGSNTKIIENERLQEYRPYIDTDEKEKDFSGIKDFLQGKAYVTHTTASVYRNVMFQNGVPEIMKNAVGTLSEASYRGDFDRYVMHLKYGKAKFVNEWVGVYRIHKKGIWQGASMFQRLLIEAKAELDYSEFYDNLYREEFETKAREIFKRACALVYQMAMENKFFKMKEYDKQSFAFLMNVFAKDTENYLPYNDSFSDEEHKFRRFMRNTQRRSLILWGSGNNARYLSKKYEICMDDIAFFVDNDKKKEGLLFMGRRVLSPAALSTMKHKYVVIVSCYYKEILEQIEKDDLCRLEDVINLYWYDRFVSGLK